MRIPIPAYAFAFALSTTPALAQSPQAADQTLGMAILSGVVSSNGTLMYGDGATSAERTSVGTYQVTFNRTVARCTPVASGNNNAILRVGLQSTPGFPGDNKQAVLAEDAAGNPKDATFALIIFCAR
jgi:hypothetical protein